MEVVREIREVKSRELIITLPDDFLETEVEILVLPLNRNPQTAREEPKPKLEEDIVEAVKEVKMIKEGKLPGKSARDLLSEL